METKELKIQIPDGYEIDKENSTFECIKFKPKLTKLNYNTVAKALFEEKEGFYIGIGGDVRKILGSFRGGYPDPNNCTSEKQAKKLIAINKLMNVAKYLNNGWKPDFKKGEAWYLYIGWDDTVNIYHGHINEAMVYFKNYELAQQAINILGEDTIRLALSTDW